MGATCDVEWCCVWSPRELMFNCRPVLPRLGKACNAQYSQKQSNMSLVPSWTMWPSGTSLDSWIGINPTGSDQRGLSMSGSCGMFLLWFVCCWKMCEYNVRAKFRHPRRPEYTIHTVSHNSFRYKSSTECWLTVSTFSDEQTMIKSIRYLQCNAAVQQDSYPSVGQTLILYIQRQKTDCCLQKCHDGPIATIAKLFWHSSVVQIEGPAFVDTKTKVLPNTWNDL